MQYSFHYLAYLPICTKLESTAAQIGMECEDDRQFIKEATFEIITPKK